MPRRKLVAGNWKMNLTTVEAAALVEAFLRPVCVFDEVETVVCPPYLSIPLVRDLMRGASVGLGAQDVFWVDSGAFTGKVSAAMLKDVGVTHCIVGHSETRGRFGKMEVPDETLRYFSERDLTVKLKIQALLYHSIVPILCVGETLDEREAGETDWVIRRQIDGALDEIDPDELAPLVVAYEPVWAIGTGKTCETEEAQRVAAFVRARLTEIRPGLGETTRVLYGGSVKASNSRELFAQPDIDGGLVGGSSLDPHQFCEIVGSAQLG